MVHYDTDENLVSPPALPPVCPKCGSHRTEVVGRSNDGKLIALRCNGCGERSEVTPVSDRAGADLVAAELEAILAVGKALTRLDDAAGRKRVLTWALERFNGDDTVVVPVEPQAATVVPFPDQTLRVDNLTDLFTALPHTVAQRESAVSDKRLDDQLDDRLDDLFDEASMRDCRADGPITRIACVSAPEPCDDDVPEGSWVATPQEALAVPATASACAIESLPDDGVEQPWVSRSEELSLAVREDMALDALMRDFVNDFRQLAMACQSS